METIGSDPASPETSTLTGVPVKAGAASVGAEAAGAASSDEAEQPVRTSAAEMTKTEVRVNITQSYNQEVTVSCMVSISF
jgi:hypothetical protein